MGLLAPQLMLPWSQTGIGADAVSSPKGSLDAGAPCGTVIALAADPSSLVLPFASMPGPLLILVESISHLDLPVLSPYCSLALMPPLC